MMKLHVLMEQGKGINLGNNYPKPELGEEKLTSWLSESAETASIKAFPKPEELSIQITSRTKRTTPKIIVK